MNEHAPAHESVRDRETPSSRGTAKGGLIPEEFAVFHAISDGLPLEAVRSGILEGGLLQKTSIQTRRSIWMALRQRYFSVDPYVARSLAVATTLGRDSVDFKSLAYLYYAIRDRIVFEFVTGPVWQKWQAGSTSLTPSDFLSFLDALALQHPTVKRWRVADRDCRTRSTSPTPLTPSSAYSRPSLCRQAQQPSRDRRGSL